MNEIFEKIYNDNNTDLNESSALFEKVYTEAEMLNEMNPKLRALLAAGLIGTASLGAASCSMPTDDPTVYEQPAPETPANPDNPDDPGDNNGGGEEETVVTFESLGVAGYAESLARARKATSNGAVKEYSVILMSDETNDLVYREGHFVDAVDEDQDGQDDISEHTDVTYICYKDGTTRYYVPVDMVEDFDAAIAAYKAAHAE